LKTFCDHGAQTWFRERDVGRGSYGNDAEISQNHWRKWSFQAVLIFDVYFAVYLEIFFDLDLLKTHWQTEKSKET
jgi:hypothetical protein